MIEKHKIMPKEDDTTFIDETAQNIEDRSKSTSVKPLKHIWPFIARYPLLLMFFLIFLTLSSCATLLIPSVGKLIVDCGFGGDNANSIEVCQKINIGNVNDLGPYFKFAFAFAVLFSVLGPIHTFFIKTLGQRVVADLRKAVYSHLLKLSNSYFERTRIGELLSRLTTDTTLIESLLTNTVSLGIQSTVIAVGAIFMMFFTNWTMSLMILAIWPFVLIPVILLGRFIRSLSRDGQHLLAKASARAGECLSEIHTVQAFSREEFEHSLFSKVIDASFKTQRKQIIYSTFLTAIVSMAALGGIILIFWYGAEEVASGRASSGEILQFTAYALFALSNASIITEIWTTLLRASGAAERLIEILQENPEIESPGSPLIPSGGASIEFNKVSFSYPNRPGKKVIKLISLTINSGENVAIVGPSGAGKSTLFQLMLRFYNVSSGNIIIGGKDIACLKLQALREQFSIVQQSTPLFSGSVMENIRYGCEGASDTDVISAAKAAYAHDFIESFLEGYKTSLSEKAATISGGQRQRIAIARAILRNAPILLLDEATSALDAESEQAVQKALKVLSKGRTTITIAHRLSTVKQAEKIIVMDNGKIVDQGTHDTLMIKGGLYAKLAKLQFKTK